jgi:hypothetical protein
MAGLMPTAAMVGSAGVGILARYLDHMLVDMIFVRMVEVTIVQIVDVAAVTHGGVSTAGPMLMSMVGMSRGRASRHGIVSFPCSKSADTAVRLSAAWSMALRTSGSPCLSARASRRRLTRRTTNNAFSRADTVAIFSPSSSASSYTHASLSASRNRSRSRFGSPSARNISAAASICVRNRRMPEAGSDARHGCCAGSTSAILRRSIDRWNVGDWHKPRSKHQEILVPLQARAAHV